MITHRFRSILGPIPDAWDAVPLSNLLDLDACTAGDWGDDNGEMCLGVVRSTNFTNDGHFDRSDIAPRFFSQQKSSSFQLLPGDILLEKSGGSPVQPVGRVIQISDAGEMLWFSNFIHLLRPNPVMVRPRFLYWVLHELHACGIIERFQNQTTQMRNLELRDYFCARIPLPAPDEQDRICEVIDSADRKIAHAKELIGITGSLRRDRMNGPLNLLKSSLLHELILGRFRIGGE